MVAIKIKKCICNKNYSENTITSYEDDILEYLKYLEKEITLKATDHKNLWFTGFGFVVIKGNTKIKIKYLDKTEVDLTDAIIG